MIKMYYFPSSICFRPKGQDSTYSKSSSLSNLSPFGTLQAIEDNRVQDFSESDLDNNRPDEGESLMLSDSNNGSFSQDMSFASV